MAMTENLQIHIDPALRLALDDAAAARGLTAQGFVRVILAAAVGFELPHPRPPVDHLLTVRCPYCGAPPGNRCRTTTAPSAGHGGKPSAKPGTLASCPHLARITEAHQP